MATVLGYRNQDFSEMTKDFNRMRLPSELPSVSKHLSGKKNQKARELLILLWMRCMNRETGDCKFKNKDIAKVLGVTERSVFRYLTKLQKYGFISRLTKRHHNKDEKNFYAIRFIRVWPAVYHSFYNIVSSTKLMWENDFRPNAYYALRAIPLEFKIKERTTIPTKFGRRTFYPRSVIGDVPTMSIFFQKECTQLGKDVIPVEAWDDFYELKDALEDPKGYPNQHKAVMVLGHSFKDYRTRYLISKRHATKKQLEQSATGFKVMDHPIPASEMWDKFKEYKRRVA